jgi:hypoxia up-regulated 1
MNILSDHSKNLIKYIAIAFVLVSVILFMGLNLPGILFAEDKIEKTEDKAEDKIEKTEDKAEDKIEKTEDKAEDSDSDSDVEDDDSDADDEEETAEKDGDKAKKEENEKENNIYITKIKENMHGLEKVKIDYDLEKNTGNDINNFEEILEIIGTMDQNQILDLKAALKENEIIEILDLNEIIAENNYIEIKYYSKEDIKSRSDNSIEFIWIKIKEFAYYYNS